MRKIFLLAGCIITASLIKAQMIVNDPLNYAQMGFVIDEGVKQTTALKTSIELMKSAKESVDKVSSVVKALEDVERIASLSESLLNNSSQLVTRIKGMEGLSASNMNRTLAQCMNCNRRIIRTVTMMTDLLTDNRYKVNDYERISLFKEQLRELERISSLIEQESRRITRIETKMRVFKIF